jgi:carbon monoxide dehydrogenase subunit G
MAVKFQQHADIDAPPERVWSVLTDPTVWPGWFPDLDQVTLGRVAEGATFQYQEGNSQGTGRITGVQPQKHLRVVTTKSGGSPVTHTFELKREGGVLGVGGNDCQVDYTVEYDPPGGFLSDFAASGNPRDMIKARDVVQAIKKLSEGK